MQARACGVGSAIETCLLAPASRMMAAQVGFGVKAKRRRAVARHRHLEDSGAAWVLEHTMGRLATAARDRGGGAAAVGRGALQRLERPHGCRALPAGRSRHRHRRDHGQGQRHVASCRSPLDFARVCGSTLPARRRRARTCMPAA